MNPEDVLKIYKDLNIGDVYSSIELTAIYVMRQIVGIEVMARIASDGKSLEVYKLPDFTKLDLSKFKRRIWRAFENTLDNELKKRAALYETVFYQSLRGAVIPATIIMRHTESRSYLCRTEIIDGLTPIEFYAHLPLRQQSTADHHRGIYRPGSVLHVYVTSVRAITNGRQALARITVSRAARELPSKLLMNLCGIPNIVCTHRVPGRKSVIYAPEFIPNASVITVGKELKERIEIERHRK